MAAAVLVALALVAGAPEPGSDAASYGPELPPPTKVEVKRSEPSCAEQAAAHPNAIVVCAQRPQGYRLNSDVMEARRDKKRQDAGRPPAQSTMKYDPCATVGPMGCRGNMGINVLAAAATAAEMAARISRGQEIGSMFVTDPQKTEYELYVEAKKRREAEAAAAAPPEQQPGPPGP
jgi:hypothetical protein